MLEVVLSAVLGIVFLAGLSIGLAIGGGKIKEVDYINIEKRSKDGES